MEKPQTWFAGFNMKNTSQRARLQMCFLIVYLLNIITSISKANTIIVSTTNANKSMYIISNKTASIIAFPLSYNKSCIKGQTTSAYSLNSYV